jgi:hypothetical protein
VATSPERYQVVLLETVGDVVVKREVLEGGREEMYQGRRVKGASLAVAMSAFNTETSRRIREASDLWQPLP